MGLNKLLVVIDAPAQAKEVLEWGIRSLGSSPSLLHLVRVCPLPDFLNAQSVVLDRGRGKRTISEMTRSWVGDLNRTARELAPDAVVSTDIEYGDPLERVSNLAVAGAFAAVLVDSPARAAAIRAVLPQSIRVFGWTRQVTG